MAGIAEGRKLAPERRAAPDRPGTVHRRRGAGGHAGRRAALRRRDHATRPCTGWARPPQAVDLADYAAAAAGADRPGQRAWRWCAPPGLITPRRRLAGRRRSRPTSSPACSSDIADDRAGRRWCCGSIPAAARPWLRRRSGTPCSTLRRSGKPVVVSMGNTAASGGYWIALAADRIVAQPGTLTGSIGVVAGKPDLAGAWRKLGVNWAEITRGDQRRHLVDQQALHAPRRRARVDASGRLALRPIHQSGRRGPRPAARTGPGDRQGPGLGRGHGPGAGPGRRAGRPGRGAGRRPPLPAAAARRAARRRGAPARRSPPRPCACCSLLPIARRQPGRAARCDLARGAGTAASLPLTVR